MKIKYDIEQWTKLKPYAILGLAFIISFVVISILIVSVLDTWKKPLPEVKEEIEGVKKNITLGTISDQEDTKKSFISTVFTILLSTNFIIGIVVGYMIHKLKWRIF